MSDFVIVQDKFVRPCREYPNGLWQQKIGDGEWEDVKWETLYGQLPVVFLNTDAAYVIQESRIAKEENPAKKEGQ